MSEASKAAGGAPTATSTRSSKLSSGGRGCAAPAALTRDAKDTPRNP
jgi:hypothetical protein